MLHSQQKCVFTILFAGQMCKFLNDDLWLSNNDTINVTIYYKLLCVKLKSANIFKAVCGFVMYDFPLRNDCSHLGLFLPLRLLVSPPQDVDQRWSEYQSRFSSLLQWSRHHMALMANKNFPQDPVELKVSTQNIIFWALCFSSHACSFLQRERRKGKLEGRQLSIVRCYLNDLKAIRIYTYLHMHLVVVLVFSLQSHQHSARKKGSWQSISVKPLQNKYRDRGRGRI